jgi:hypothetical protein
MGRSGCIGLTSNDSWKTVTCLSLARRTVAGMYRSKRCARVLDGAPLWRKKHVDELETEQMHFRIKYLRLHYAYFGAERIEAKPCGQCCTRSYLEGHLEDLILPTALARQANNERSAVAVIQTMKDIKRLRDGGVIDTPELKKLKRKALEDLK